jgi:hypothetical protein
MNYPYWLRVSSHENLGAILKTKKINYFKNEKTCGMLAVRATMGKTKVFKLESMSSLS